MSGLAAWRRTVNALAAEFGATVEISRGDHLRIRLPNGAQVFTANTPSDRRARMNLRSDLRRVSREPRRSP